MSHADDALKNREVWTKANAEYTDRRAAEAWAKDEIDWGMFSGPESELNTLGDVDGKDVIELGCGTAYFGAWLAKRGARVVGVDITPAQLETARRLQRETGLDMEFVEASAEDVPLDGESFDLAISGSPRPLGCSDPAAGSSSSATRRSRSSARPTRARSRSGSCVHTQTWVGSSGRARTKASNTSFRMAR
jgi:hypothetical protein